MGSYAYVAIGSAFGGAARFTLGAWLQRRLDASIPHAGLVSFPIGTLLVNVTGSFVLGVLAVAIARRGPDSDVMRLLLAVGFCGGYTTFSTFSFDTVALLESGGGRLAALNVVASVALALLATFAGIGLGRLLLGAQR